MNHCILIVLILHQKEVTLLVDVYVFPTITKMPTVDVMYVVTSVLNVQPLPLVNLTNVLEILLILTEAESKPQPVTVHLVLMTSKKQNVHHVSANVKLVALPILV